MKFKLGQIVKSNSVYAKSAFVSLILKVQEGNQVFAYYALTLAGPQQKYLWLNDQDIVEF